MNSWTGISRTLPIQNNGPYIFIYTIKEWDQQMQEMTSLNLQDLKKQQHQFPLALLSETCNSFNLPTICIVCVCGGGCQSMSNNLWLLFGKGISGYTNKSWVLFTISKNAAIWLVGIWFNVASLTWFFARHSENEVREAR